MSDSDNVVTINLDGKDIVLKPSLGAFRMISRQYGGMQKARQQLTFEDFDAAAFVIRVGSGMTDREARRLDEMIYESGLNGDLLMQLINYVAMLSNRGRPVILGEDETSPNGRDRDRERDRDHNE